MQKLVGFRAVISVASVWTLFSLGITAHASNGCPRPFARAKVIRALSLELAAPPQLEWADLETGTLAQTRYPLTFQIDSQRRVAVPARAPFRVIAVTSLAPVRVFLIETQLEKCSPDWQSARGALQVVKHPVTQKQVGVELEPSCRLLWYIEHQDWYSSSWASGVDSIFTF